MDMLSLPNSKHVLGYTLPEESLEIEYKEFRLELVFESEDAATSLYHDTHRLRDMFYEIILKSIQKYTCKYTCSFFNAKCSGTLRYGVSDNGEIIGVPILESDVIKTIDHIKCNISEEIKNRLISIEHNNCDILNKINVNYHKIDTCKKHIYYPYPDSDKYIKDRTDDLSKYRETEAKFLEEHRKYISKLEYYKRSINTILAVKDIRNEFKGYLKYYNILDKFSKELEDTNVFSYRDNDIKMLKTDINNIVYWITKFRDYKVNYIIDNERVKKDYKIKKIDPYFSILQEFKPMVSTLLDRGFSMYIIDVSFDFILYDKFNDGISYKFNDGIRSPVRSMDSSGSPYCKI